MSPSLDTVHDSARHGVLSPPGMGFTRASWMAYSTRKGAMKASVSFGSSQRAARVTCTPHVMVPSGAAAAGAAAQRDEQRHGPDDSTDEERFHVPSGRF